MSVVTSLDLATGQREPGTRFSCERCGATFEAKNRNGVKKRFCSEPCRNQFKNTRRLEGAALLKAKSQPKTKGPSRHAQAVSREVFQALVPVAERAELIRASCQNLGITDEAVIQAALTRNWCEVPACV